MEALTCPGSDMEAESGHSQTQIRYQPPPAHQDRAEISWQPPKAQGEAAGVNFNRASRAKRVQKNRAGAEQLQLKPHHSLRGEEGGDEAESAVPGSLSRAGLNPSAAPREHHRARPPPVPAPPGGEEFNELLTPAGPCCCGGSAASHRDWKRSLPEGTAAAFNLQLPGHLSPLLPSPLPPCQPQPSSVGSRGLPRAGGKARYQVDLQDKAPAFHPGGGSCAALTCRACFGSMS